jgi:hypothetical protein
VSLLILCTLDNKDVSAVHPAKLPACVGPKNVETYEDCLSSPFSPWSFHLPR